MNAVADFIGVPHMRVYEVATFYTMFNRYRPLFLHLLLNVARSRSRVRMLRVLTICVCAQFTGGQVPRAGVHDVAVPTGRRGQHADRARAREGARHPVRARHARQQHAGQAVHHVRSGVPRRVRQRANDDRQRRLLRTRINSQASPLYESSYPDTHCQTASMCLCLCLYRRTSLKRTPCASSRSSKPDASRKPALSAFSTLSLSSPASSCLLLMQHLSTCDRLTNRAEVDRADASPPSRSAASRR